MAYEKTGSYGKRPMWQWIAIYAVIGAIVYGVVYYAYSMSKGGYSAPSSSTPASAPATSQPSY